MSRVIKDKEKMKVLLKLVFCAFIAVAPACQQSIHYEAYVDQNQQGEKVFYKDVSFCKTYTSMHADKSEGSQGSGERFIRKQKLFSLCMEKKQWILKS